jgi:RNA polymerase sigma-70 factor (ECF subfamily)
MYHVARGILANHEDAEDALQETFMRLYKYIHRFRFKSAFSTWLYRIAVNTCYDVARRSTPRDAVEFDETWASSEKSSIEARMQLEEALAQLPVKMRTCFVLFAVEGFKQAEIADIVKTKLGTVKAQVYAAKRRLRDLLSQEY